MGTTMTERDVRRLGPQLYNGIERSSLAFKLLTTMGWKEGDGLGASRQGIKEHLKVKKKFDNLGMGAAEQMDRTREWTTGMWTYDKVLSGLKEVKAQHKQLEADNSSSSSSSDDEKEEQPGKQKSKTGSKAGRKAVALKQGQKARPANKTSKVASSSSSSSGSEVSSSGEESDDDSDPVPTPSPSPAPAASKPPAGAAARVRMATHVGRYQKRERAKMVRGYSANDLAAILGAAPSPGASQGAGTGPKAIQAGRAPTPSSSEASSSSGSEPETSSSGSESDSESEVGTAGAAGKQQAGKSKAAASETAGPAADAAESGPPPWWNNYFVRATRRHIGDKQKRKLRSGSAPPSDAVEQQDGKKKIHVNGFREQDQENLYEAVQNGAVHGKQGLGRAAMPKKVAGARWQGKKTKLGSDSDSDVTRDSNDEVGLSDVSSDGEGMDVHNGGIVVLAAKSTQQAPAAAAGPAEQVTATDSKAGRKKTQGSAEQVGLTRDAGKQGSMGQGKSADSPVAAGRKEGSGKKKSSKRAASDAEQSSDIGQAPSSKKQKKQQDSKPGAGAPGAPDGIRAAPLKLKWAKLIKAVLASVPKQRMSLVKLKKRMLGLEEVTRAAASHDVLHKQLLKKVNKSKKFVVKGDIVHLAINDSA